MSAKNGNGFAEEVWFLYGIRVGSLYTGYLVHQGEGSAAHVEFDWSRAFFKKVGVGESNARLIGFYHSHPGGHPSPSGTDISTMDSWVKAMGRPMLCGIISGSQQRCYLFMRATEDRSDPESAKVKYKEIRSSLRGNMFLGRYRRGQ